MVVLFLCGRKNVGGLDKLLMKNYHVLPSLICDLSLFFRVLTEKPKEILFTKPRKYIQCWSQDSTETGYVNIKELAEAMCKYDLDDMDLYWLQQLNAELGQMGKLVKKTMFSLMKSIS